MTMTTRMTQVARNNSNTENGAATSCRGDEAGAGGSRRRGRGTAAGVDDGMIFSNNEWWNSDSSVCGEWGVGEIDDNGRAARCDC